MELRKYLDDTNGLLICPLDGGEALYSHNASRPFKSASVIKTYILAYYLAKEGDSNRGSGSEQGSGSNRGGGSEQENCSEQGRGFGREIEIPKKALIGTSIMTELKITKASLYELLVYMMGFSDNSATNALLADAGFDALNSFCKEVLKTENTVIGRKMLDFKAVERGEDNLTCLEDCLKAMRFVLSYPEGRDIMRRHKGVERIMRYIYSPDIEYYGKGGDIPGVYNDIAVLRRPKGACMFAGVLSYMSEPSKMKRLVGRAGLAALGAERPVV